MIPQMIHPGFNPEMFWNVTAQLQMQPVENVLGTGAYGKVIKTTDRSGCPMALKKIVHVFDNLVSCRRVYRELTMMASFRNENVLSLSEMRRPENIEFFDEIEYFSELMEADLYRIIVSGQPISIQHVKLFMYQILRGMKYLHSANILHRDIKPMNLLVNSNCLLKICDFGLSRVWDASERAQMTNEVVTEHYRAPELLMGARRYTETVDMWSVGCVFAELMGGRILFQADSPIDRLDLIVDRLGNPPSEALRTATEGARVHVMRMKKRRVDVNNELAKISPKMCPDSICLMRQLLEFDPEKRISASSALFHPFVSDGRAHFHAFLCGCCTGDIADGTRTTARDMEPVHSSPLQLQWERDLDGLSMFDVRDRIIRFASEGKENVRS